MSIEGALCSFKDTYTIRNTVDPWALCGSETGLRSGSKASCGVNQGSKAEDFKSEKEYESRIQAVRREFKTTLSKPQRLYLQVDF